MRRHPLIVRGDVLAHHVQEVVRPNVAQEVESLPQIGHGMVEPGVRAEVPAESAVLSVQVEHRSGVVDGGLDLPPVPDDPRVSGQPIDVRRVEAGHGVGIEPSNASRNPSHFASITRQLIPD